MFITKLKRLNGPFPPFLEIKRHDSTWNPHIQMFFEYFGLNKKNATEYIKKENLRRIPIETINKITDFCEERGYTKKDMLKNPMVFRLNYATIDQYYCVLHEGGFRNVSLKTLTKFRTICRTQVSVLRDKGLISPTTDVADCFASYASKFFPEPKIYVETDPTDTWGEVHFKIFCIYLQLRLNATPEQIFKLISTHPTTCRKSFKYLDEIINIAEEIGFTHEKMLRYGYILRAYPKNVREILEKYPVIAGVPIAKAIRMYPKLMTAPPSNFADNYNLLKKYNIPEKTIARGLGVFQLGPLTIESRLKELQQNEEFQVFLNNPNLLKLVVHQNRAKSRLSFLKQLQLKCSTVSILGDDNETFDTHIREGIDANNFMDTLALLKGIFQRDIPDFASTLRLHPHHLKVPLTNIQQTYNFLKGKNFSDSAILRVVYILLYPEEKITPTLEKVEEFEKTSNRGLTQINKLNLIVYFIEKEHHFSGDGIWTKKLTDESLEDLLLS